MKFNCITFYSSTEHTEQGIAFILKVHEVTPAKKKPPFSLHFLKALNSN